MQSKSDIRVVIAEDDFMIQELISRTVKGIGYKIAGTATDGEEAVRMVCSTKPDVVLMDIRMPKVDGLEASVQIQRDCPTPVVALTSYESEDLVEKASRVGIGAYLIKPPDAAAIERAVIIAMARHQDLMEIKKLIDRKDTLLKEIHNRVKNNLNVVSNLLYLQSRNVTDEQARHYFDESRHRIQSIALLHERLYRKENMFIVDLPEYFRLLTEQLMAGYEIGPHLNLDLRISSIQLDIDRILPCALIVTELVSNSLKHAFPDRRPGTISLTLQLEEKGNCILTVADTGIGLPSDFQFNTASSPGIRLILSLTEQLQGSLESNTSSGTEVRIVFPYIV